MSQKQIISRKREICLRIGNARVKAPRDAGEYVQQFTVHRGYPTHADSIWYLVRWCKRYLPLIEEIDGQIGDKQSETDKVATGAR